jgi:hypothetical protein
MMRKLAIQLYQKYPDNLDIHQQFPEVDHFTFDQYLAYTQTIAKYFLRTGKLVKAAAYIFPLTFYEWREHNKPIADTLYLLVIDQIRERLAPEFQITED